jgi:hypothetical protein
MWIPRPSLEISIINNDDEKMRGNYTPQARTKERIIFDCMVGVNEKCVGLLDTKVGGGQRWG